MRCSILPITLALSALLLSSTGVAQEAEREPWELERVRLGASLTYSSFEQQVKAEVGGTAVQPLVVDRAFGLHVTATANLWRFFRLGIFVQLDAGKRSFGRYEGLTDGEPEVTQLAGGRYWEVWLGPLLRFQWRFLAAEIGYGLALMPLGARRDALEDAVDCMFSEDFGGRILPFDTAAAYEYPTIVATRKQNGAPIAAFDAMIAAIARSRGTAVATRNVKDFDGCGVAVIDPWQA